MLFMVIERFKDRDAKAVYARFEAKGRQLPEGIRYVDSWVEANLDRCFQLIECDDATLLQQWVGAWHELVEFEFYPVVPSKAASRSIKQMSEEGGKAARYHALRDE